MERECVELILSVKEDRELMEQLYGFYLHDLSEFAEGMFPEESGYFDVSGIAPDYEPDGQIAFKIVLDGATVGFISLTKAQRADLDFVIQAAFVLRGCRGQGVGKKVLKLLFQLNPGRYWLAVLKENTPALRFWQSGLQSMEIKYEMGEVELQGDNCDFMIFNTLS